ncbi:MAG: hypothetical protein ACTHQQ_01150 [Solirubrobacteraceae bacterium]
MAESVCVVTVHGIGFQQPPSDGRPGYADALHGLLRDVLGDRLGDDPERPATGGPVYVSSEFDGSPAEGLGRLDVGRPLLGGQGDIAHVALVYSPSEPLEPRFGETAEALARAAISHGHYASTVGVLRLLVSDVSAAVREDSGGGTRSTLTPRRDLDVSVHHGVLGRVLHRGARPADTAAAQAAPESPRLVETVRALQDDIATYVTRNDLRERVRDFVEGALLLLADRPEISAVVINAHSQGTVVCWDVLCRLPFSSWARNHDRRAGLFRHFATAGSPIRKYVDMFAWGDQVGELAAALKPSGTLTWHNFVDPHDPVADPLNPPAGWRPGDPWDQQPEPEEGLLVARDANGTARHVHIYDLPVDNIQNSSGGGLQAHDYWNNEKQFVTPLSKLLQ